MNNDCSSTSRDLKDLKSPMWLSAHITEVFVASPDAPYWTGTGGDAIYGSRDGNVFVSMAVESVTYSYETSQYSLFDIRRRLRIRYVMSAESGISCGRVSQTGGGSR